MILRYFRYLVLLPAFAGAAPALAKPAQQPPVTILISIDGFRASYLHRGNSSVLDGLADKGLSGSLRPSFPSITFPNHYTLVTGLRPDEHGIVNNSMVDAARPDVTFKLADQKLLDDPFWWDEAEPIWVTAEKQGVHTATMFWPGSTAPIHGQRPSDWQGYAKAMPSAQRIRAVVDWLRRPAMIRPRFVTLYFDEVDTHGHEEGPDSPEAVAAIKSVDSAIGALRDDLKALGQPVNFVIVADHGMAPVSADRFVDLDKLVAPTTYRLVAGGPTTGIAPLPGQEANVAKALVGPHEHMRCWLKGDMPAAYHYGHNARVPAIVCLAETGWEIAQSKMPWDAKGDHGFDPDAADMAAVFIAQGPAFPAHRALAKTDNVDVYPLLAKLIGVTPLKNDGDPAKLAVLARP